MIPLIREKGGAYGGGASANESGTFTMYSYRDPRVTETYDNFEKAI
jgi:Zn-dependent M16 (insulinase) family peptidase